MSLKAMPIWMYHGIQDDYQFNDVAKPENLTRLPPLNEQEVIARIVIHFFVHYIKIAVALLNVFLIISALSNILTI